MAAKMIAVFGATGAQGSSVLKSLTNSDDYKVKAITRNANTDKAKLLAKLKNVTIQEADLNDPKSLDKALEGCYGTFLVTEVAIDHNTSNETQQGTNLIESAIKNKVSHVVFSGLDNASQTINKPCIHLDNKEKIEQYGMKMSDKINFTSIRLPAYYQVIPRMIRKTNPSEFLITLPMSDKPMYCMNVDDLGECVKKIFDKPSEYKSKIVEVAGDQLKGAEIADIMNKHLKPNKFIYANISLEKYRTFGFAGVEEFANMFEYFQSGKMKRDIELTKKLNPNTLNFSDWMAKNREAILKNLPV